MLDDDCQHCLQAGSAGRGAQVKETEKAAAPFGIRLVVVEAGGRNYERAFSMKKSSSLWRSTAHPPYTRGAATWRRTGGA